MVLVNLYIVGLIKDFGKHNCLHIKLSVYSTKLGNGKIKINSTGKCSSKITSEVDKLFVTLQKQIAGCNGNK